MMHRAVLSNEIREMHWLVVIFSFSFSSWNMFFDISELLFRLLYTRLQLSIAIMITDRFFGSTFSFSRSPFSLLSFECNWNYMPFIEVDMYAPRDQFVIIVLVRLGACIAIPSYAHEKSINDLNNSTIQFK